MKKVKTAKIWQKKATSGECS